MPIEFLSTPSARRATKFTADTIYGEIISIHALREEGDAGSGGCIATSADFYPRPPRGGRLVRVVAGVEKSCNFYPRPPRGGRPARRSFRCRAQNISIHALREEGDLAKLDRDDGEPPISIHALREEGDRDGHADRRRIMQFLSTPSARRATRRPILTASYGTVFLSTPSARRATQH